MCGLLEGLEFGGTGIGDPVEKKREAKYENGSITPNTGSKNL